MLFFLIIILMLYCCSFVISLLSKQSLCIIFPICISGFCLAVYLLTIIFKSVYISAVLSVLTGFVLSVIVFFKCSKTIWSHFLNNSVNSTIVYFLIVFVSMAFAYYHGSDPILWDEFAHWGQMCKEIFRLDYFYITDTTTLTFHNDYPPLIPLWESLPSILSGSFSLTSCYSMLFFMTLTFFIPLFKEGNRKELLKIFAVVPFINFLVIASDDGQPSLFLTIYLDSLLAITAGYIIYKVLTDVSVFELTVLFSFLVLIKQSALIFCGLAILIYLIKNIKHFNKYFFVMLIVIAAFYLSWKFTYSNSPIANQPVVQFDVTSMVVTADVQFVVLKYLRALLVTNLFGYLPIPISYVIAVIAVIVAIIAINRVFKNKNYKGFVLAIILTAVVYAFFMLFCYLFMFKGNESIDLVSYKRYMNTGLLCIYVIALYQICSVVKNYKFYPVVFAIGVLVFVLCLPRFKFYDDYRENPNNAKNTISKLDNMVEQNTSTFILDANMTWKYINECAYYAYGYKISRAIESTDYVDGVWKFTDEEVLQIFANQNYLYVGNMDYKFYEIHKNIFNIKPQSNTIYNVKVAGNKVYLSQ